MSTVIHDHKYYFPGICDCQSTRDTFLYAASVDSRGLEPTVEILGEILKMIDTYDHHHTGDDWVMINSDHCQVRLS